MINIKYIYIIITILIQTITQLTLINNIDPTLVDYEIIDLIINKKKIDILAVALAKFTFHINQSK